MTKSDLIILGGGSAGVAAAIRAQELGARVTLINEGIIGGTCVNTGCVPSKTLIRAAEAHHRTGNHLFAGIESSSRIMDFGAIIRQKDELVDSLRKAKYSDVLAQYDTIKRVEGQARFLAPDIIMASGQKYNAPKIIVATGARPWLPQIPGLQDVNPLTSTSVLELDRLPESMVILGGRYIGLEYAQMLARLGTQVTLLQRSDYILPTEDEDVLGELTKYLSNESIQIHTGVHVEEVHSDGDGVSVNAIKDGKKYVVTAERILCATGRRPVTNDMGLEDIGIRVGQDGELFVNDTLQTNQPGIYGAGDVVGDPAFVYTAAYEGRLAVDNALGEKPTQRDYTALPWVIFTDPQIAGVGLNEKDAAERGLAVDVAKLELKDVPRALAARDTRGFIKLIDRKSVV